jgi:FtsH-binding integral membrane protein
MRWTTAAVLDLCCVVVFVVIGRASHDEAYSAAGLVSTAWPFLAGLAIGWALTRAWRRPAAVIPTGVGVWLSAVVAGMVLRALSGQGTAAAFVVVTLIFLGVTTLGWRAAVRRRTSAGTPA